METIKVAVHGLGNIGKYAIEAIESAPDMQCAGVIRRAESLGKNALDLRGIQDFSSMDALVKQAGKPHVVVLACPSRAVPELALQYINTGFATVDSFDIHSEIPDLVAKLDAPAQKAGIALVTAAGWDPGTDSVLRAVFEAMAPTGVTFTNFGRGRSMGHSVAAKNIEGVADAISITIPLGGGRHSRLVYAVLKKGASFETVKTTMQADPYFSADPFELRQCATVEELAFVADASHGVAMERVGASGLTANQHFTFDMRINNPALTAQVMVACARATQRLTAGCHTMIDIPPVKLLAGDRMGHIKRLV